MAETRWYRLAMFALLYFVQGSALAYISTFMKPHLNSYNIDADSIGLLGSLLLVPFILKIFIGLLSDRVSLFGLGYRKPYIVIGLLLAMMAFASAAFVSPGENFTLFAALLILGSFSITLFDSATDGFAIDTVPAEDHDRVQSIMTGSRAFGLVVLSAVFGALAAQGGYPLVFMVVAASVVIPLLWIFPVKEPVQRPEHQTFQWSAFKAFGHKRFLLFAAYAILGTITVLGVNGLITYHLAKTFNAPETMIGNYGTLRGVGAVTGSLVALFFMERLGRRASLFGGLVLISIFAVLIGLAPTTGLILALAFFWGILWGFMDTVGVALAMDLSDPRIAASMFAFMMALFNIGNALSEIATGLTDNIGFTNVFFVLAGVNLLVIPIVYMLFRAAPEIAKRPVIAKSAPISAD